MKNKSKKISGIAIFVLAIITLNIIGISALAIGFGNTIAIEPGQTIEKSISLLNSGQDAKALIIKTTILDGSKYIKLSQGDEYNVSAGGVTSVPVVFSVPSSAKSGDIYPISISFDTKEQVSDEGGAVEFKIGHTISFNIEVFDKIPTEAPVNNGEPTPAPVSTGMSTTTIILLIAGIIVVIAIIWFLIKKKK